MFGYVTISYTSYLCLDICVCFVVSVQKGLPLRLLRCPVFRHRDHYVKALIKIRLSGSCMAPFFAFAMA